MSSTDIISLSVLLAIVMAAGAVISMLTKR